MGTIENERVARYREHVPLPPAAYMFSYQQRQKQRLFFEHFLYTPLQQQPYSVVNLCQMKIIAVRKYRQVLNRSIIIIILYPCLFSLWVHSVPDDNSIILRYIIETLFILHCETKLNMICPVSGNPD